jgi:hypothetical protein
MTDTQSMTTHELVHRTLLDEHGDFLKEAVAIWRDPVGSVRCL